MEFSSPEPVDLKTIEKMNINPKAPTFVPASLPSVSGSDTKIEPVSPGGKEGYQTQQKREKEGNGGQNTNRSVKYLTCWYWLHQPGGCIKSDEQCLYSHYDTGMYADKPVPIKDGCGRTVAGKRALRWGDPSVINQATGSPTSHGNNVMGSFGTPSSTSLYQSPYGFIPMMLQNPPVQRSPSEFVYPSPSFPRSDISSQRTPERRLTVGAGRPSLSPQGIPTPQPLPPPGYHVHQPYTPTPAPAMRAISHDRMELMYSNMNTMMAARKLDECICNLLAGLVEMKRSVEVMRRRKGFVIVDELAEMQKLLAEMHKLLEQYCAQASQARQTAMGYVKPESNCHSIFDHQGFNQSVVTGRE